MCGPSDSEKTLQSNEQNFSSLLQQDYAQRYGAQSDTLNTLNGILKPIAQAGPSQTGESPQQVAAETTQALNTTGGNYANAARALNGQLAGRGGDNGLESGVDQQIKGSLASSAAGQLSNEELGITQKNYDVGRQNWLTATGGLSTLAGQENPASYASEGTEANSSAFGQADTINTEQNALAKDIAGGITSLGSDALTFGAGAVGGGGFSGGMKALAGNF